MEFIPSTWCSGTVVVEKTELLKVHLWLIEYNCRFLWQREVKKYLKHQLSRVFFCFVFLRVLVHHSSVHASEWMIYAAGNTSTRWNRISVVHLRNYNLKCAIIHVAQIQKPCEETPAQQLNASQQNQAEPILPCLSLNLKTDGHDRSVNTQM